MKKFLLIFILIVVYVIGCANVENGGARGRESMSKSLDSLESKGSTESTDITGKEWKLVKAYVNDQDIQFRRDTLPEYFKDIFTLNFDGERISGTAAPNLYSAPYSLTGANGISVMPMLSTLMASISEPANLKEHEFFNFMQSAYEWSLANEYLLILSRTEDGREVRLVFGL